MKAGLHIPHMSGIWSTTRLKSVSFHLDLNHLIQTVEVTGQKSTFTYCIVEPVSIDLAHG